MHTGGAYRASGGEQEREGPISSSKDIMSKNLSSSEPEGVVITSETAAEMHGQSRPQD